MKVFCPEMGRRDCCPMTFFITMVISVTLAWVVHLADRRRLVS